MAERHFGEDTSKKEAVLEQNVDGIQTIPPGDFLALRRGPRMIRNGHLQNLVASPRQTGGNVWLDVETNTTQTNVLQGIRL